MPNEAASSSVIGSWNAPYPWPSRNSVDSDGKISAAWPVLTTRKKIGMNIVMNSASGCRTASRSERRPSAIVALMPPPPGLLPRRRRARVLLLAGDQVAVAHRVRLEAATHDEVRAGEPARLVLDPERLDRAA